MYSTLINTYIQWFFEVHPKTKVIKAGSLTYLATWVHVLNSEIIV